MKNVNLLLSSVAERFRFAQIVPLFLVFFLSFVTAFAQSPGDIDLSFGNPLTTLGDSSRFDAAVNVTIVQPDGKFIAGGNFTKYNGNARARIVRLNQNGTLDNSFTVATGFNSQVWAIALHSDGKVIVGGNFTTYNGATKNYIARLNANGSADNTFNIGSGFNRIVNNITIQKSGKIIVSGSFDEFNGVKVGQIVRLNADGTLDNSFTSVADHGRNVGFLALDKNDNIYAVGNKKMSRFTPDGTPDNTFSNIFKLNDDIRYIRVQASGKLIVSGSLYGVGKNLVRLNLDGTLDATFNPPAVNVSLSGIINVLSSDKIVVTQLSTEPRKVLRLNADGSLDNSFSFDAKFDPSWINAITELSNGRVLFSLQNIDYTFYSNQKRNGLMVLRSDGSIDPLFHVDAKHFFSNTGMSSFAIQKNGKILVTGNLSSFSTYNGVRTPAVARIFPDGSADTTFKTTVVNGSVIAIQPDNKIILGKLATGNTYDIGRLDTNGATDNTFATGAGFNGAITSLALQPDGKILVGGAFTQFDGQLRGGLVRLEQDGVLDVTFTSTFNGAKVYALALLPDGKALVAGEGFSQYNGADITGANVIRVNADGSLDPTFKRFQGNQMYGTIYTIALQTDGKILIGGDFIYAYTNGGSRDHGGIARLNSDGSFDESFTVGVGFEGKTSSDKAVIYSILPDPKGQMTVGGYFNFYKDLPYATLIRLNANGSVDTSFSTGTGFSSTYDIKVRAISKQADGKLIVGGAFENYQGYRTNSIVRIQNGGTPTGLNDDQILMARQWRVYPNPSNGRFTLACQEAANLPAKIVLSNALGEALHQTTLTDMQASLDFALPAGMYFVTFSTPKGLVTKQLLIQAR